MTIASSARSRRHTGAEAAAMQAAVYDLEPRNVGMKWNMKHASIELLAGSIFMIVPTSVYTGV